jgi:hypothetical protein
MRKPISPTLHGVLDYATGATLIALPQVLGIQGTAAGRVLRVAGAGHAAYSLVTDYRLGVRGLLPFRAHLALDAVGAVGVGAAPFVLGTARKSAKGWVPHVAVAAYELTTVALTRTEEEGGESSSASAAAPPVERTETPEAPRPVSDAPVTDGPPLPGDEPVPMGGGALGGRADPIAGDASELPDTIPPGPDDEPGPDIESIPQSPDFRGGG